LINKVESLGSELRAMKYLIFIIYLFEFFNQLLSRHV